MRIIRNPKVAVIRATTGCSFIASQSWRIDNLSLSGFIYTQHCLRNDGYRAFHVVSILFFFVVSTSSYQVGYSQAPQSKEFTDAPSVPKKAIKPAAGAKQTQPATTAESPSSNRIVIRSVDPQSPPKAADRPSSKPEDKPDKVRPFLVQRCQP